MSYVVLARKWRPMTFSDLVGQEHVAETLGNAIKSGRVAHAFLFTGVRGVGKTTSARIMAKALNCLTSDGPTAAPCLECAACKEIAEGSDIDVQEIDGASYNGVDEVRRLQESLPYRPTRDRFKIVIVDEVHMLSQSAWNAFLKTLEEPPPHVKFIFATTEVHKVPITILSRMQRFDFKLIPTRLIVGRLQVVLAGENVEAEEAALTIIAREAAGSMRDAMSLLDQVIAWSGQTLTESAVARVLGVASRKILYDLAGSITAGESGASLKIIDDLSNQGFDVSNVARDLLAVLRDVVVTASSESAADLVDLPEDERASVAKLAEHSVDDLLRLHQGFSAAYDDVVRSSHPRAALEMLLVRLCRRPPLVPINDLVERLIKLEKRLHGAANPPGTSGSGRSGGARKPQPAPGAAPQASRPQSSRREPSASPQRRSEDGASPEPPAGKALDGARSEPQQPPAAKLPPAAPGIPSASDTAAEPEAKPKPRTPADAVFSSGAEAQLAPGTTPADETLPGTGTQPVDTVERWRSIIDRLRETDPKRGAFLDHAQVAEITEERIAIRYRRGDMVDVALQESDTKALILDAAEQVLGRVPQFTAEIVAETENGSHDVLDQHSVFAVDKKARQASHQAALDEARKHPMLEEAVRVLGARVKNIDLPKD